MEAVRIRVPKRQVMIVAVAAGVMVLVYATFAIHMTLSMERGIHHGLALGVSVTFLRQLEHRTLATAGLLGVLWLLMGIFLPRHLNRAAVVVDEEGIRVENVWFAGRPMTWAELQEVLTSDNHTVYALVAAGRRLRIPQWAGKELWSELERRVPLRLERKTWSTRRYVCQTEG